MFFTITHYFNEVGLEIKDVCYMVDKSGALFWSEINQDCKRIVKTDQTDKFDKDIWRSGGSASKEKIVNKWLAFNDIMMKYFREHPFHKTEIF